MTIEQRYARIRREQESYVWLFWLDSIVRRNT